jgi:hypothetical protein
MASTELNREEQIQQDVKDLHRLGYAQRFISVLTGAVLLAKKGLAVFAAGAAG